MEIERAGEVKLPTKLKKRSGDVRKDEGVDGRRLIARYLNNKPLSLSCRRRLALIKIRRAGNMNNLNPGNKVLHGWPSEAGVLNSIKYHGIAQTRVHMAIFERPSWSHIYRL